MASNNWLDELLLSIECLQMDDTTALYAFNTNNCVLFNTIIQLKKKLLELFFHMLLQVKMCSEKNQLSPLCSDVISCM